MAPTARTSYYGALAALPGTASALQANKASACCVVENNVGGKEVKRPAARCRGGGEPAEAACLCSSSPGVSVLLLNSKAPQSEHQAQALTEHVNTSSPCKGKETWLKYPNSFSGIFSSNSMQLDFQVLRVKVHLRGEQCWELLFLIALVFPPFSCDIAARTTRLRAAGRGRSQGNRPAPACPAVPPLSHRYSA